MPTKTMDPTRLADLRERYGSEHEPAAAALAALEKIRELTSMALPSEQTGPEWERCVRVPIARMRAIDAEIDAVLGPPAVTGEPMPALHQPASSSGVSTKRLTSQGRTNPRRTGPG